MDAKPEPGRSQPGVGVQFRGSERGRGGMSDHVGGGGAAVGGGGCPDRRAGVRQGRAGRVRATADGMRIGDGGCPRESGGLNGGGSSDKHGWDPVSRAKGRRCWWVTWGRDPGVRRSGTLVSAQRRSTYGCPGPGPTYRSPGPDRPSPEGRIGVAVGVQTERRPERVAGEARVGIGLERRWVSRVGSWWVSRTVAQNRRPGGLSGRGCPEPIRSPEPEERWSGQCNSRLWVPPQTITPGVCNFRHLRAVLPVDIDEPVTIIPPVFGRPSHHGPS